MRSDRKGTIQQDQFTSCVMSERVKVVQIAEDLGIGGLERNLRYIVENVDHSVFSVEVWCLSKAGTIADELIKKGYTLRVLDLHSYHNPRSVSKLVRLLRLKRVNILHSHGYFANTFGRVCAILARVPIRFAHIQSSHWTHDEREWHNYLVDRILSRYTNRVIACSDAARKFQLEAVKVNSKKLTTIHNCTDMKRYGSLEATTCVREEFGMHKNDLVVGSVGRLQRIKGHRILLEILPHLIQNFPSLKLVIVGQGEEREDLEQTRSALGLEGHVIFTGPRVDVERVLPVFDVYVQPTIGREGLPLTVVEAMAARLPVVASDIGGTREAVIHCKTGLLTPPGDRQSLIDSLSQVLSNKQMRCEMGEQGWKVCKEKFSVATMSKAINELYLGEVRKIRKIH